MSGDDLVSRAAHGLREHDDPRWHAMADRVVRRVLATPQRAESIRAESPGGPFRVSGTVVMAAVRARVEAQVAGCSVIGVDLLVTPAHTLTGLHLDVGIAFGTPLGSWEAPVRAAAVAAVRDVTGTVRPAVVAPDVQIRVVDVTTQRSGGL